VNGIISIDSIAVVIILNFLKSLNLLLVNFNKDIGIIEIMILIIRPINNGKSKSPTIIGLAS